MGKRRRRRPRLDAPEPLDELLERAGENRFAKKQLPVPLVTWRQAVGPRIADRARPIALERGGVLVVKVATSVWANELSLLAPQLIEKLVARGIEVKSLRFRVGPLDVIEGIPQRKHYRRVPPPVPLAPDLQRSLAGVEDEELRQTIERAARANLAWQAEPARPAPGVPTTAEPRAARVPRDAETESAPRGHRHGDSFEASPRKPGGGSDRRR
jgi:hypothetical protein